MDWLAWQLADSALPTGGFAHSAGLEAACQAGQVAGEAGVADFARQALWQAGYSALPLVGAAHARPQDFAALDREYDAFLSNPVANRASRLQGRALLLCCAQAFPGVDVIAAGPRHHAPVHGAVMRALGMAKQEAQALFLYITARGVISAAVRLGRCGPFAGQALLHGLGGVMDEVLARCAELAPEDVAQTAPLIDLWQGMHDRLYSRLFQS